MAKGIPALHPEEKGTLDISPKVNWVEKHGGLPPYINSIAVALVRKGMTRSHAIQIAVNSVKKTCATGHWGGHPGQPVSAAIRTAACSAAARWEAMKAATKADTSIPAEERRVIALAFALAERDIAVPANENGVASTRPKRRLLNLIRRAIFADHLLDLAPSTAERNRAESKGQAMQGGRFPIRNRDDLSKAIRAVGRARPNTEEERRKVRRFIIKRARALNATNLVPDNWSSDGSLKS